MEKDNTLSTLEKSVPCIDDEKEEESRNEKQKLEKNNKEGEKGDILDGIIILNEDLKTEKNGGEGLKILTHTEEEKKIQFGTPEKRIDGEEKRNDGDEKRDEKRIDGGEKRTDGEEKRIDGEEKRTDEEEKKTNGEQELKPKKQIRKKIEKQVEKLIAFGVQDIVNSGNIVNTGNIVDIGDMVGVKQNENEALQVTIAQLKAALENTNLENAKLKEQLQLIEGDKKRYETREEKKKQWFRNIQNTWWTVDMVCHWLENMNLEKYKENFLQCEVDGFYLVNLTDDDLRTILNINSFADRAVLLKAINYLKISQCRLQNQLQSLIFNPIPENYQKSISTLPNREKKPYIENKNSKNKEEPCLQKNLPKQESPMLVTTPVPVLDGGENEIQQAIFVYPEKAEKAKIEGNTFFTNKKFLDAINEYDKALSFNPYNEALYSNRSAAYLQTHQHALAVADARKCIKLAPNWIKGYFRLGKALLSLGRLQEAREAIEQSLRIDPVVSEIQELLNEVEAKEKSNLVNMGEEDWNINFLPSEVLSEIMSYLWPEERSYMCSLVCRRWASISQRPELLRKLSMCHFKGNNDQREQNTIRYLNFVDATLVQNIKLTSLTRDLLSAIITLCPNVQTINFSQCYSTPWGVWRILDRYPKVKALKISTYILRANPLRELTENRLQDHCLEKFSGSFLSHYFEQRGRQNDDGDIKWFLKKFNKNLQYLRLKGLIFKDPASIVEKICASCSKLTTLKLCEQSATREMRGNTKVKSDVLQHFSLQGYRIQSIILEAPALTKLDLRQSSLFQTNMNEILADLRNLKILILRNTKWHFSGTLHINIPELTYLDLSYMNSNNPAKISIQSQKLSYLLVTQVCGGHHSSWLQSLLLHSTRMRHVDVSSIGMVSLDCPNLESLVAHSLPDGVRTEKLKKLKLYTCDETHRAIFSTTPLAALEHLVLHCFLGFNVDPQHIPNLKTIESCKGNAHGISDKLVVLMNGLPHLQGIHLHGLDDLTNPTFKHPTLRELVLGGSSFSKAKIKIETPELESFLMQFVVCPQITMMPKVTQLSLHSVKFPNPKDFETMLGNMPQVRKITIIRCHWLTNLKVHHPLLEQLSADTCNRLIGCDIVAIKLRHLELVSLKKLQEVGLQCTRELKIVNFRSCKKITDATFPDPILPFPGATQISFAWTNITNVTLKKLSTSCPSIQHINLKGCTLIPTLLKKVMVKNLCYQESIAGKLITPIEINPIIDYYPE